MAILHDRVSVITPHCSYSGLCSFSSLHTLMRWKDMKGEDFQNWSLWQNISLKKANDKTDFAINN
jgi:hypothetical protein